MPGKGASQTAMSGAAEAAAAAARGAAVGATATEEGCSSAADAGKWHAAPIPPDIPLECHRLIVANCEMTRTRDWFSLRSGVEH